MATINVLFTTFPGLGLPSTLCLSIPQQLPVNQLSGLVASLLPSSAAQETFITTNDGRRLPSNVDSVGGLLQSSADKGGVLSFLPLRLNVRLRGGKGGFGSQLRAAGGRMSSRKKKQNAEQATGSARNLDGRRLRTITEAKNLATYLATKPDMDRKEKEEKRKRWQAVVELAEQREADMRAGKTADGRRKGLSSEWVEEKEEVSENVKAALKLAMAANDQEVESLEKSQSADSTQESADEDSDADDPMELDENDMNRLRIEAEAGDVDALWVLQNKVKIPEDVLPTPKSKLPRFAGFDDDLSDSDLGDEEARSVDNDPKAVVLAEL